MDERTGGDRSQGARGPSGWDRPASSRWDRPASSRWPTDGPGRSAGGFVGRFRSAWNAAAAGSAGSRRDATEAGSGGSRRNAAAPGASRGARTERRRPLRVVVGVVLLVAIGLLWPFADWNWWPVVAGLGVLVLLYLLRLNWLLLGWARHLAGLVTVTLLLGRTGPWVWGFAAGLALLGYGLVRLPDWRPAAVGLALTAVFGIGYGVSQYRTDAQLAQEHAATRAEQAAGVMATPAELLVPSIT